MKKSALIFLSLLLLLPCSCKRYSKEDIVGMWVVTMDSSDPLEHLGGLNKLSIYYYQEDGTVENITYNGGLKNLRTSSENKLMSKLFSGEWKVSGNKIYRDLAIWKDTLDILSIKKEETMQVVRHTKGMKPDTTTLMYYGKDPEKAAVKIAAMASIFPGE